MAYDFKKDALSIMMEASDMALFDKSKVMPIFEDINSPATNSYLEKL